MSYVPLATVLARLDECFEEPLTLAAKLPGFAEYEKALAAIDGWPSTGDALVLLKGPAKSDPWGVIANLWVLAAAKIVGKSTVPCFFIAKDAVHDFVRANAEGGLKPPGASAEEEEEMLYRASWLD